MKYHMNRAVDTWKRKKRNTVVHNCENCRSPWNDSVQRESALMDLICQFDHKNRGVGLTDLVDRNHVNRMNRMYRMYRVYRVTMMKEEEEERPFPGEGELSRSEEEGERLKMEARYRIGRRGNYLGNYCWNNHRPNNRSRHQRSLNPRVEHLHRVRPHLLHHKSDDVSDHLEPYHEFNLLIITSYATLISLNILSASSRLSVFLSGCHLSANFLYLDMTCFLPFLRFL